MEDRHAEPFKRSCESIGVAGRRECPRIDERRDPTLKEHLHHIPCGPRPDLLVGDSETEDREDIVVVLEASDQGILNGKIPVRPPGPGEEESDASGVPGGIPGKVCVSIVEDALRIRVVGPLPVDLLRRVVRNVHTGDLCLNVADQVLDILSPSIEEVGVHGRDDTERDGRGRPPGIGVAKRYDGNPFRKAAEDLIPDRVARGMGQDDVRTPARLDTVSSLFRFVSQLVQLPRREIDPCLPRRIGELQQFAAPGNYSHLHGNSTGLSLSEGRRGTT